MFPLTPWVQRLLLANVVVFIVTLTSPGLRSDLAFYAPFVLYRPWTLVTYMFLHGSVGHLFFNMIAIFFFAPRLESRLGGRTFLWLYFVSGMGGAIFQTVYGLFATQVPMIGASGGVFGILMGFAMFWPRERILLFPIPIPVEARVLVTAYIVIALVSGVGSVADGIAHFAHLGGAAFAFAYLRWHEWRKGSAKRDFQRKLKADASPTGVVGDRIALARWQGISVDSLHELNRDEVERLLAKASEDGASSLTDSERAFLDRMASG